MTATERLRALLTERGVEWRGGLPTETMVEADGLDLLYVALPDGRVRAFIRNYLTPEQAIAATLGRGTCHPVASDNLTESEGTGDAWADCSECGHLLCVLTDPSSQMPNYCPNCGARVVPSAAKAYAKPRTLDVERPAPSCERGR